MYYSIGEMAKMLGVATSTLRYYDKEGLLPFVERSDGGIRRFKEGDLEWLRIIECLKKTGMQIKDIKIFIEMAIEGDNTINRRLAIIENRREAVRAELTELQNTLDVLDYKYWYYTTAKETGSTAVPRNMDINDVPAELRKTRIALKKFHE